MCRAITRQHAKTFYLGSLFLSKQQRAAAGAVYAVCRNGDDLAEEPHFGHVTQRRALIEAWWQDIQAAYDGTPSNHPIWIALAWAVTTYDIPLEAFEELYLGFQMDLQRHTFATMADLELYCQRVADVVGLMIAPICGYDGGEETLTHALQLGCAMQLTNILRDVGENLQRGRLYLPTECFIQHNLDRSMLERGEVTPEYQVLLRELIALARSWYHEADKGIAHLHQPGKLAIAIAAHTYADILTTLEHNQYDNLSRRAFVTCKGRLEHILRTVWHLYGSRQKRRNTHPSIHTAGGL
ncbi:MAG: phytoene/squalene synthase family protein [Chloroflexi bacterium AL-W]|nr:phytoene/squalene synthase family protein [Chloroflexi bacterium AL-N1]NOK67079.1 phytoene/squalene synthase family protein [Chloroflexi bacterium AL-N10]NOK74628.1 phytoene/squalene synthase family protein [Chloroflexi bacterium AL-N5]NOK81681.1 phytoene/squalene synthase family protein [Chloroflexi bacterium AL-W]NOK89151.1 phytoene/squalene synthase family protein [Chloroflexi bacterium AL-N15]